MVQGHTHIHHVKNLMSLLLHRSAEILAQYEQRAQQQQQQMMQQQQLKQQRPQQENQNENSNSPQPGFVHQNPCSSENPVDMSLPSGCCVQYNNQQNAEGMGRQPARIVNGKKVRLMLLKVYFS